MSINFTGKFIWETVYHISSESPKFYRRYCRKHFVSFSGHTVLKLTMTVVCIGRPILH